MHQQQEKGLYECQSVQHDLAGWIKRIKNCLTMDSLTRSIVVQLIDRIEVSEIYSSLSGEKNIDISISYKFGRLNGTQQKKIEPIESPPAKKAFQTSSIA